MIWLAGLLIVTVLYFAIRSSEEAVKEEKRNENNRPGDKPPKKQNPKTK